MIGGGIFEDKALAGEWLPTPAVIDVGSNTIHLLVGEVADGMVMPIAGEKISARLGSGVDKTGRIEDARMSIAAEAITLFARLAALHGASEPAVLATSAVRDAENGPELIEEVRERAGLKIRLVSGEEEALLGFRGAVSALGQSFSWEKPALVVDLGGGSAQLIFGDAVNGPQKQVSLPLGSNRTTERFLQHDPPNSSELQALREAVPRMLPDWEFVEGTAVVAIGGSARTILKLTSESLAVEHLTELVQKISRRPSAVMAREEGLAPERARVMPAAITTLSAVLEHFGGEQLTVARGGIREGAILAMVEGALDGGDPNKGT